MNIQKYQFEDQQISIVDQNGEPWFLAADVCEVLGLENVSRAIDALDEDEKTYITISDVTAGTPRRVIINESGLYSLVLRSRKPEAKRFKKWVTSEVLPQIRKTGQYVAPMSRELQLAHAIIAANELIQEKDATIAALAPKAESHDAFMAAVNTQTMQEVAKVLGIGPNTLFKKMRDAGILMWNNIPYQEHIKAGRFRVIETTFTVGNKIKSHCRTLVTSKGIDWLSKVVAAN